MIKLMQHKNLSQLNMQSDELAWIAMDHHGISSRFTKNSSKGEIASL
jgi:hypothetical protein